MTNSAGRLLLGAPRKQGAEQSAAQLGAAPQQPALEASPHEPSHDALSQVGALACSNLYVHETWTFWVPWNHATVGCGTIGCTKHQAKPNRFCRGLGSSRRSWRLVWACHPRPPPARLRLRRGPPRQRPCTPWSSWASASLHVWTGAIKLQASI